MKYRKPLPIIACVTFILCLIGCSPQVKAPDTAGESGDSSDEPVVAVSFSEDSDCSMCHSVETDSMEDTACLASLSSHASMDCLSCHEYGDTLQQVHADVEPGDKPGKELKETVVSDEACLTCHNYDELAQATADVDVLTDINGTTVNPHEVHSTGTGHGEVQCSSCHKMHAEDKVDKTAQKLCISCHHEKVYECGTCH